MPNLAVAQLTGVFGLRGELKCRATSAGLDAVVVGQRFFLDAAGERAVEVVGARRHHQHVVIALQDVATIEAAQALVGSTLYLPREQVPLHEGEFFDDDLVGLQLVDLEGRALGLVRSVVHYPAQDCLVIEPKGALVPLVRAFIRSVDLAQRHIIVDLPKGLLDEREAEEA